MSVGVGENQAEVRGCAEAWYIYLLLKAAMGEVGNLNIHESERDHKVQSIFK